MTEKQIVTDLELANNIRQRLVDPRAIEAIILTTTQSEQLIQGYPCEADFVEALWNTVNNTCAQVLRHLPLPNISVHIGTGSTPSDRTHISSDLFMSLVDNRPSEKGKLIAFLQIREIPKYDSGVCGPRHFHLLTICRSLNEKNEIRILNEEILPECDSNGRQLIELRIAGEEHNTDKKVSGSPILESNSEINKKLDARESVNEGATLFQAGDFAGAEVKFLEAIATNPQNAVAHANIGNIYFKRKQYENAIPWLQKALTLDPKIAGVDTCLRECQELKKPWWQFWK